MMAQRMLRRQVKKHGDVLFIITKKCLRVLNVLGNITMNELLEQYPDVMKMDGYDDCIIGICHRFNQPPISAYSLNKLTDRHIKDGMTREEALEYISYNQTGAWVGENTPCFIENE